MASLDDGLLDVVIVKKMSKFKMLWTVLRQVRNGHVEEYNELNVQHRDVLYFQTPRLLITNLENAPLHIDGDPAETTRKFSIQIIPQAFKLIQPIKK